MENTEIYVKGILQLVCLHSHALCRRFCNLIFRINYKFLTIEDKAIPFFVYCRMRFLIFGRSVRKGKKKQKNLEKESGARRRGTSASYPWSLETTRRRCIFAATKPAAAQMEQLSEITDALQYSCGAPLIPEDHELSGVLVVRQDVSCGDRVDKLYYSVMHKIGRNLP